MLGPRQVAIPCGAMQAFAGGYPRRDGESDPYQIGICDVSHGCKANLQKRQRVRRQPSVPASVEAGGWNLR